MKIIHIYKSAPNGVVFHSIWNGTMEDAKKAYEGQNVALVAPGKAPTDVQFYDIVAGKLIRPPADVFAARKSIADHAIEVEAARIRVIEAQAELDTSDYQQSKWLDGDVTESDYAPIKAHRAELRKEIRDLRSKYPELEPKSE